MKLSRKNPVRTTLVIGLSLLILENGIHAAETEPPTPPNIEPSSLSISDRTVIKLDEKSFTLGLAYSQVTYKTTHEGTTGNTQITDNGAPSLILEVNSKEKVLTSWQFVGATALVGWDFNGAASYFNTHNQLTNTAFRGNDIGTSVSGEYVGIAPILFFKVGPLYPGSSFYWKVGYGIGPGLLRGKGNALFSGSQGEVTYDVGSNSPVFALYNTATWQLQSGNWYFDILGKWLQTIDGKHTSLESYGFGAAYRFVW